MFSHLGLSYGIVEVSSLFHFEAGYSLDDDIIINVKFRLLLQWMKAGLGSLSQVLGPFLGTNPLFIYLSVCLSVYLSVLLFVRQSIQWSIILSVFQSLLSFLPSVT